MALGQCTSTDEGCGLLLAPHSGGVSKIGMGRAYRRSALARFHKALARIGEADGSAVLNKRPSNVTAYMTA
jgi:hypothetical protein